MEKNIAKFPHVVDDVYPRGKSKEQLDLLGEGILKLEGAEFMRKKL